MKNFLYESLDFKESYEFFFEDEQFFLGIGPCALENLDMTLKSAEFCKSLNIKFFRAFIFKLRTSVYDFLGLGENGIDILKELKIHYPKIKLICEIFNIEQYEIIKDYIDIFQIGARSMYNTDLLSYLGKKNSPIILKRHFGSTIYEWLNMAEYYLYYGGRRILLCERGIKSFEPSYRYSFDILSSSIIRNISNIPVIADPSHPAGNSCYVKDLALAAVSAGFKGLIIETHPNPKSALSDSKQQLSHEQFLDLYKNVKELVFFYHKIKSD